MSNVVHLDPNAAAIADLIHEQIEDKASENDLYAHYSELDRAQLAEAIASLVSDLIQTEADKKEQAKAYGETIKSIKERLTYALAVRRDKGFLMETGEV